MLKLIVIGTNGMQITHELIADTLTVGRRSDNAVLIKDRSVSSHHAELSIQDGQGLLSDLNSTNGTYVNGERIAHSILRAGDRVRFGNVEAVFAAATAEAGPPPGLDSEPTTSSSSGPPPLPVRAAAVLDGFPSSRPEERSWASRLAYAAIVLGLLCLFSWKWFGVPALLTGHLGLLQIKRDSARRGRRLVLCGLGCAYLTILFGVFGSFFSGATTKNKPQAVNLTPTEQHAIEQHEPLEITPAANVDNELFLLRNLENLYDNWPAYDANPQQLQNNLEQFRNNAERYVAYLKSANADPKITAAYVDLVEGIDFYVDALVETGMIAKRAEAKGNKESLETSVSAGWNAGLLAASLENQGAKQGDALAVAAVVGIADFLWSNYNMGMERDAAKQAALDAANRKFRVRYSSIRASNRVVALNLTTQKGWHNGEAGFDDSDEDQARVQQFITNNDLGALTQLVRDRARLRPRDPFAKAGVVITAWNQTGQNASADQWLDWSRQCLECASLVPTGIFYDEHRANFLSLAGWAALQAANKQSGGGGWKAAPFAAGKLAVIYWKTYLKTAPKDSSGAGRECLAIALATAGQFQESLNALIDVYELRKRDPNYNYNLACLYSIQGDSAQSLTYLRAAISTGYLDIRHAKSDPDLAMVRRKLSSETSDLFNVKYIWDIHYGFMKDDITLTNQSAFGLTNVVFKPIIKNGGKAYDATLKADFIAPGTTVKWADCISVTGSHADSSESKLECAQQ